MLSFEIDYFVNLQSDSIQTFLSVIHKVQNLKIDKAVLSKEFFRTCNVLPFSFVERQGKRPKVHAKQKGSKNFFNHKSHRVTSLQQSSVVNYQGKRSMKTGITIFPGLNGFRFKGQNLGPFLVIKNNKN